MSYSEKDGQVILTMSREDYHFLSIGLGLLADRCAETEPLLEIFDTKPAVVGRFLDRLNEGNPNYTPYQVKQV